MTPREEIGHLLAKHLGSDIAADFSMNELGREKGHAPIWRVNAGGGALRLVAKRVTPREYDIHRLVAKEIPGLVPDPVAGVDAVSEACYLITEDLVEQGFHHFTADSDAGFPLARSIADLAAIHVHFEDKVSDCELDGVPRLPMPADTDYAFAVQLPDLVGVLQLVLGLEVDDATVAALKRAGECCEFLLRPLHLCRHVTLVHGDFHQANIMFNQRGDIKVLDWGSSGLAMPQWDLVMLDRSQVRDYLEAARALGARGMPPDQFHSVWHAATIFRMYQFLRTGVLALMTSSEAAVSGRIFATFPFYVQRLLEAVGSAGFDSDRGHTG